MKKTLIFFTALLLVFCVGCSTKTASTTISTSHTETTSDTETAPTSSASDSSDSQNDSEEYDYSDLDFSFVSQDIYGEAISSDIYSKNKLTLVNIFATWCPPCIEELPHLAKLNEEFKDQGFQIIGFVTDTKDYTTSNLDEEAIDAAKTLYQNADLTYPFIVPDDTFLGGLLFVQYVPTSVFLDENGKMVGEPIVGANSFEGWKDTITERLNSL